MSAERDKIRYVRYVYSGPESDQNEYLQPYSEGSGSLNQALAAKVWFDNRFKNHWCKHDE